MRVSELIGALRELGPDAEVAVCIEVPDGEGDHLLFSECPSSFAEPYPGDDGRLLVHATVTLEELAAQACDPSAIRELAKALVCEADKMELAAIDPEEE